MPKYTKVEKDGRVHAAIDPELKQWAQDYAKRHRTNLSALITQAFENLRRKEATLYITREVEQL